MIAILSAAPAAHLHPAEVSIARGSDLAVPSAWTRAALTALLLWLLAGPRIDLPVVRGLRVEDLVLALLALICAAHLRAVRRPSLITAAILGVAAAGLVSALVANLRGTIDPVSSVLFAVRPVEYWIAFPAGLLLLNRTNARWSRTVDLLLAAVTLLQTAFAVAQYYFGLPIGFSHAAYTRAAGLTVGPYELGAISAMLLVYWVASRRWILGSVALVGLASSISRVSLLGAGLAISVLAACWAGEVVLRIRRTGWRAALEVPKIPRLQFALRGLSILTSALVLAFTLGLLHLPATGSATVAPAPSAAEEERPEPTTAPGPDPAPEPEPAPAAPAESIATRLESTSVLGSWIRSGEIAKAVPPIRDSAEYSDIAYARYNWYVSAQTTSAAGAEASNLVRFFRWHVILNTINEPSEVLFGLGPSFVGPSVDGSYLRFFAEGGILGIVAWGVLVLAWGRRTTLWMRCVVLSLMVGALFIDIVYAERPMVLFWVLLASATMRVPRRPHRVAASTTADALEESPIPLTPPAAPALVGARRSHG